MPRQYHCDYCFRSFKDSAQNRKKHLRSSTHLNAKREYWLRINKSGTSWLDKARQELEKSECKHFYRHNWCKFGDCCRYSHLTPQSVQLLKDNVLIELNETRNCATVCDTSDNGSVSDTNHSSDLVADYDLINARTFQTVFGHISAQQIPVSLIPAKLEQFSSAVREQWSEWG